ncbi:MAG: ferritin-like domain-containing protein [Deltaproteobacteria bacterium]|jgi:1,2-phenylacetyl-CoA epoxidase catalytic subunit|nr:ferritin-like domain-containing protein [Deltaproteobacteria bacterium]
MANFLDAYSIQNWLESAPQGYLEGTQYGHQPGESEPELLMENEILRQDAIRGAVQLVVGERAALAASSGLINIAPDHPSKRFLATQTLDEARHVEIFSQRLLDLGVKKKDFESTIEEHASPDLVNFAEVLLEKVDKGDFLAGVVGQNIVLEGLAFTVFEFMEATNRHFNPKFAHTLEGTIADERRHVGFGENRIGSLIKDQPERRDDIQEMQKEMTGHMLRVFQPQEGDQETQIEAQRVLQKAREARGRPDEPVLFQGQDLRNLDPETTTKLLTGSILGEFKVRLGRIGLEYQDPTS